MQKQVWNPGMKQADGMVGGEFAISQKSHQHVLVFTGWENQKAHQAYMVEHFPGLKSPEEDMIDLKGEQLIVEGSWRVCPK
jgi:hypothetical protein